MFSFSPSGKKVAVYLNSFHTEVIQKNAKVYYIFPSIPDSAYQQFKKNFIDFNKWLNENIAIPIIGSPEQFILPESFFFDTHYHLNKKGVESRTQTIIDKIKVLTH
ncbi:MAG: hypothetical protein C0412_14290 [Flavobacterium sp.]|nr:hypothetical protein [Flavobacterium sp.]